MYRETIRVPDMDQFNALAADVAGMKAALDFMKFFSDPKGSAKRAEELIGLTTQAIEAKAAVEKALADLEERKAAADRYENRVNDMAVELWQQKCAADEARKQLLSIHESIVGRENALKRQLASYAAAGIIEHDGGMSQDLPTFGELSAAILGKLDPDSTDVHYGTDDTGRQDDTVFETERLPDASAVATVRQSRRPPRLTRHDA
jgi:hypothetical protein